MLTEVEGEALPEGPVVALPAVRVVALHEALVEVIARTSVVGVAVLVTVPLNADVRATSPVMLVVPKDIFPTCVETRTATNRHNNDSKINREDVEMADAATANDSTSSTTNSNSTKILILTSMRLRSRHPRTK